MAATLIVNCVIYYVLMTASVLTVEKLVFSFVVLPKTPKWFPYGLVQQYRKWYRAGPHRILLQQLDDVTVTAAPAALHPAELLPVPEVSEHITVSWFSSGTLASVKTQLNFVMLFLSGCLSLDCVLGFPRLCVSLAASSSSCCSSSSQQCWLKYP